MALVGIDASRAITPFPTGTEVYSRRLTQALLELAPAHRFRLYLRTPPPDDNPFPQAETRLIPFPRLWTHLRLSWEMARHPPDILFVPAHVVPLYHPPLTLVTVHDLGYLHFPQAHPRRQRAYLDLSTRWNSRAAAHLLADSAATKTDLMSRYGTPEHKITVAYPGYDDSLVPVRDPAAIARVKRKYAISGDYFLYLGTLQPRKNLSRLIAAFAALDPGPSLVLAGRKGWLCNDLAAQVERLGLQGRVIFTGYVPETDKPALLSGAIAFTFPSLIMAETSASDGSIPRSISCRA